MLKILWKFVKICFLMVILVPLGVLAYQGYTNYSHMAGVRPYLESCDAGDANACKKAGQLYLAGEVIEADETLATLLHLEACNMGDGEACSWVGLSYEDGTGVEQNKQAAKRYFGLACSRGHQDSCLFLPSEN